MKCLWSNTDFESQPPGNYCNDCGGCQNRKLGIDTRRTLQYPNRHHVTGLRPSRSRGCSAATPRGDPCIEKVSKDAFRCFQIYVAFMDGRLRYCCGSRGSRTSAICSPICLFGPDCRLDPAASRPRPAKTRIKVEAVTAMSHRCMTTARSSSS